MLHAGHSALDIHALPVSDPPVAARHLVRLRIREREPPGQHDRAGDFASDKLHVVERFTRTDPNHMRYEATIEDPTVFSRPWKISMPLYRRVEKDARILEFKCVEFAEELIYGQYKKK